MTVPIYIRDDDAVERAVAVAKHTAGDVGPIVAVVPIGNTQGVFPSSSERYSTTLSYVFTKPGTTFGDEVAGAKSFARVCFEPSKCVFAVEQQDAADKRRAIGALRAPSSMRRLQLILVLSGRVSQRP